MVPNYGKEKVSWMSDKKWAIRSQATNSFEKRKGGRSNDCKAYRASGIYSLAPWETMPV